MKRIRLHIVLWLAKRREKKTRDKARKKLRELRDTWRKEAQEARATYRRARGIRLYAAWMNPAVPGYAMWWAANQPAEEPQLLLLPPATTYGTNMAAVRDCLSGIRFERKVA